MIGHLAHRHAGLPAEVPEGHPLLDKLCNDGGVAVAGGDVHWGHAHLGDTGSAYVAAGWDRAQESNT